MIKYKYLSDAYTQKIAKERNALASNLEIKATKEDREINFLREDIDKINKVYIILAIFYSIMLYPFYTFLQEYLYLWSIFIYFAVAILSFIVVFIIKKVKSSQIKKLKGNNKIDASKEKENYLKSAREIYDLTLFIMVINENYDYLASLDALKQKEEYKKIASARFDTIKAGMNYHINSEKWQRYFEDWMKRREEKEEIKEN